jgi:hypothetical protein
VVVANVRDQEKQDEIRKMHEDTKGSGENSSS